MSEEVARHLHLLGATAAIRAGKFNGVDVLIVPVVALQEGVIHAVNASTPEFVPYSSLVVAPQGWNGRPVVLDHPAENGQQISANSPKVLESRSFGTVFNTRVEGRKLLMEAWIDPARAEKVAPKVLARLRAGQMIEVSVGVFVTAEDKGGEFKGKPFHAIWREIVPDHLAFLSEGDTGACSVAMGCGSPRAAAAHNIIKGDEYELLDASDVTKLLTLDVTVVPPAPPTGPFPVDSQVLIHAPRHPNHGKMGFVRKQSGKYHAVYDDAGSLLGTFHQAVLRTTSNPLGINQYTSGSGAAGGRKGENFVKKAHAPESYGSHYKNIKDAGDASTLFEQAHASLERQGYERDKPTSLPFEYQREASFTHPVTGHTAELRKDYFAADPDARAAGYKGSSQVSLKIKAKNIRGASNPEGINQYTKAAALHEQAAVAHDAASHAHSAATAAKDSQRDLAKKSADRHSQNASRATHAAADATPTGINVNLAKAKNTKASLMNVISDHRSANLSHQDAAAAHREAAAALRSQAFHSRAAGGPGSGIRGHVTPHELAARAHEAAATKHEHAAGVVYEESQKSPQQSPRARRATERATLATSAAIGLHEKHGIHQSEEVQDAQEQSEEAARHSSSDKLEQASSSHAGAAEYHRAAAAVLRNRTAGGAGSGKGLGSVAAWRRNGRRKLRAIKHLGGPGSGNWNHGPYGAPAAVSHVEEAHKTDMAESHGASIQGGRSAEEKIDTLHQNLHDALTAKGYKYDTSDHEGKDGNVSDLHYYSHPNGAAATIAVYHEMSGPHKTREHSATVSVSKDDMRTLGGPGSGVKGHHTEASHPTHPLPDHPSHGSAVYDLKPAKGEEYGQSAQVEKQHDGSYYGRAENFDFSAKSAGEMRAKLKEYGGRYAGWENARHLGGPGSGIKGHTTDHGKPIHEYIGTSGSATIHRANMDDPNRPTGHAYVVKATGQDGKTTLTYHKTENDAKSAANAHVLKPLTGEAGTLSRLESYLREDGYSLHDLPTDRLKSDLDRAIREKDDTVTVKVPSRSEVSMSIEEAKVALKKLGGSRGRFGSNPEGINQYTKGSSERPAYSHSVTTHTPNLSYTSSMHHSAEDAHAAAKAAFEKSGHPQDVSKIGRAVGERTTVIHTYGTKKARGLGGPGSGIKGHTTNHEAAAKLHLAAAAAHEAALSAHDHASSVAQSAGEESPESKAALQASRDAHEASRKAQNETESFAGNSPRSEARDAKNSAKRALHSAKEHDNEIAASVHSDAIFAHQQAAKSHYREAGLRMAGGVGSGIKGHTSPHTMAIRAHKMAISEHQRGSKYAKFYTKDAIQTSKKAARMAPGEHASAAYSHAKAAYDNLLGHGAGSKNVGRPAAIKSHEAAIASHQAAMKTAGGVGSGVKGHTTPHEEAALAHEKAAAAHQAVIDRLAKMKPSERKQAEEDDLTPGSDERIHAEELSKDALAATTKASGKSPNEDAANERDAAAFEAHQHAHDAVASASDGVYEPTDAYAREALASHKAAAHEHRNADRAASKTSRATSRAAARATYAAMRASLETPTVH